MIERVIPEEQLRLAIEGKAKLSERDLALEVLVTRTALDVVISFLTLKEWNKAQAIYKKRCETGI